MTGIVFNIQRYSIHDGPGIRTTVFLKGCPLSCTWCHNPEGLSSEPEILVVADRCIGCGACMEACPSPPPVSPPKGVGKDRTQCVACGSCVEACYAGARRLVGQSMTSEELLKEVERDRPFYQESGGGVTFSGGEPLMQGRFLMACLRECRERGMHTAVDTCGFAERGLVIEAGKLADLFLFDLKVLDAVRHQELTGAPIKPILDNLSALDAAGVEIAIRFPLIPGITDAVGNIEALGKLVGSLENTRQVHVLPFHRTASDKYARLGRLWAHEELEPSSREAVEGVAAVLGSYGLEVRTDGWVSD